MSLRLTAAFAAASSPVIARDLARAPFPPQTKDARY